MSTPLLSVVTPVYNDPDGIDITLDSLTEQSVSASRYEVLAVDNGSTDRTPEVIESYAKEHGNVIRHLEESAIRSSYAARNQGVCEAKGSHIAFLDADMYVEEDWTRSVIDLLNRTDWAYVGCRVEVDRRDSSMVARYSQHTDFPVARFIETEGFAPTCSLVVESRLFDELGSFDDQLISGGDIEFGRRVQTAGIPQNYSDEVVVYHPAKTSLSGLLRRHWRVGRGFEQLRHRHPDLSLPAPPTWKHFLPPTPTNFRDTVGRKPFSNKEVVMFYLLEYSAQLSKGGGRVRERIFR